MQLWKATPRPIIVLRWWTPGARTSCWTLPTPTLLVLLLRLRPPPASTLFPYTTLFRSAEVVGVETSELRRSSLKTHERSAQRRLPTADYVGDRKSTRLNSSHPSISYAAFCLKKQIKVPSEEINAALESYTPANHRSQVVDTGRTHILLDASNANPSSIVAAVTASTGIYTLSLHDALPIC